MFYLSLFFFPLYASLYVSFAAKSFYLLFFKLALIWYRVSLSMTSFCSPLTHAMYNFLLNDTMLHGANYTVSSFSSVDSVETEKEGGRKRKRRMENVYINPSYLCEACDHAVNTIAFNPFI